MSKVTVIIKRNASYEKGMYGLSIHNQPGGAANVEPIDAEDGLRRRLLELGLTLSQANDVIGTLKKKHDDVKLTIDLPTQPSPTQI